MNYGIYTIRDMAAELSGPLFISRNNETAARTFREFAIKNNIPEEEYKLFKLGTYDDEDNCIVHTDIENNILKSQEIKVLLTPSQPPKKSKDKKE